MPICPLYRGVEFCIRYSRNRKYKTNKQTNCCRSGERGGKTASPKTADISIPRDHHTPIKERGAHVWLEGCRCQQRVCVHDIDSSVDPRVSRSLQRLDWHLGSRYVNLIRLLTNHLRSGQGSNWSPIASHRVAELLQPWEQRLINWKCQFSYDHWSQATLSSVSTWMGDCSSVAWVLLLTLKVC